MSEDLRVVIVGVGMIGEIHHRASQLAGGHLVGVVGSTAASTAQAAARWRAEPLAGPEQIAHARPDVVHVCTPNRLHAAYVEAALAAGAHVICEKPLSVDGNQAQRLARLAQERARVAAVPFVYRFHPLVREIRARASAGEFGAWQLLHGSYLQDWLISASDTNWRVSAALGGPSRTFADIGSHWCDLMEFVTGERIATVQAVMSTTVAARPDPGDHQRLFEVDTEDAASVIFRTENGVLGSVVVSQVSAGRKNRLWFEFDGAAKSAVFDQENPETAWLGGTDEAVVIHRDPHIGSADQRRLAVLPPGHAQGFGRCFEAFVADTYAAIDGATPDGLPTFADGVRSAHIVDAVVRSARTGTLVRVGAADS